MSARAASVAGALALLLLGAFSQDRSAPRWWKGNTHTHTLWSDGDAAPELVVDWYARQGYAFLVLSDHNVFLEGERWTPITEEGPLTEARLQELRRSFGAERIEVRQTGAQREMRLATQAELRARFEEPGRFLLLSGEEITDSFEHVPVHVNGVNLVERIDPPHGETLLETIQNAFDAVSAQEAKSGEPTFAHLNHPNFKWSIGAAQIAELRGERFFEIYNGHPATYTAGDAAHPSTERLWDEANTRRAFELDLPLLFGLATDDAHNYHATSSSLANAGRGWIMVRAAELTPSSLVRAIEAGEFYATTGVSLADVRVEDGALIVDIAPEPGVTYTTQFVGTRAIDGERGPAGEILLETQGERAVYRFDGSEGYVRARIVSNRPMENPPSAGELETAWTQPIAPE